MSDEYNSQIEHVATLIEKDKMPFDEQDEGKLQKYYDFVKSNFHHDDEKTKQLVNEAFLYLQLKNAKDFDPLQKGDEFGAGFS